MKRIAQTLAVRLFLILASVQTIILLALAFAVTRIQQASLMEHVVQNAARMSEVIARSTRHSMLVNMKDDVHRIIASIGGQQGIEKIRIYNKLGEVVFATVPNELGTVVDMNAEACITCHSPGGLENPHPPTERLSRIFSKPAGERVLGLITPIRNEIQCSDAACHAHPASKTILGVLDVQLSLSQVDRDLMESRSQLLYLSVGAMMVIGLVSGGFIWLFVRRPVKRLIAGMEMVGSGRLDHRLQVRGHSELEQLARAFNLMTGELENARKEITQWSDTLEQKVKEKTSDLERAHRRMLVVEKMASLGNLSSSVAHELNNPLEGILTYAKLMVKRIGKLNLPPETAESYRQDLQLIADEAQRCGNIVKNLLIFARQKELSFQTIRMADVVQRSVMLVGHHAEMHNVRVETSGVEGDVLECDPNQIEQVLVALMVNAVEAMAPVGGRGQGGVLSIRVERADQTEAIVVRVADTGPGMSEEVKAHIFEPFFTTKSEGKGVGLGLAISYGIIERHHGSIAVQSAAGVGTTFVITLPLRQPQTAGGGTAASPVQGVIR